MPFVVLSVSGPNGVNGQNGRAAAISSGSYMDGDDGEDATNPTRGKDAGGLDRVIGSVLQVKMGSIHCGAKFWIDERNHNSSQTFPSFAMC
ncbi:unnamed protein product [Rhizophagus irregularis]|nr:unnamed protein product [Rhizophagus irregularis]